jgi:TRAP transporter TAXI family solute receptor
MVLLPVEGEIADKIMKGNPGVFHKSVFAKGSYSDVGKDVNAIAITAVLQVMDTFPADRLYQILKAIFDHKAELAAVWKGATALTPAKAIGQVTPEALKYLHPGAEKYFKEKGVLK